MFAPLLQADDVLANTFVGIILGVGPGRGIGLIFMSSACLMVLVSVGVFAYPRIRNLELEIPDAVSDT